MAKRGIDRGAPGTIGALVAAYRQSPRWLGWADSTRKVLGRMLEKFGDENRDTPVGAVTRGVIKRALHKITAERGYGAGVNWLKAQRGLWEYALDLEWIELDPTHKIAPPKPKNPEGFKTWADHEIEAFRTHWPVGTIARRVFEVTFVTAAARIDAVKLGWMNLRRDGVIEYKRQKVGTMAYPIALPSLLEVIDGLGSDRPWLSSDATGRARSEKSLTNDMAAWTRAAGLPPGLGMHGLRKARCRILAESGAQPHEIMAWAGHTSIREAERYTRAYNRAAASVRAAERLVNFSPVGAGKIVPIRR